MSDNTEAFSDGEEIDARSDAALATAQAGYFLDGERLRNYGFSRRNAANAMGLKYPLLPDDDDETAAKTGSYPGIFKDAVIVLWVCSIPDTSELTLLQVRAKAWTPERAFAQPVSAMAAALEWAEPQPWSNNPSKEFFAAANTALKIVRDSLPVFEVEIENAGEGEKKEESFEPPGTL